LTEVAADADALGAALPLGEMTMVDRPNGCTTKMMRTATTITTIAKMATIAAFDPPSPCVLAIPYHRETI